MYKIIKNIFMVFMFIASIGILVGCNKTEPPKLTLESDSKIEIFFDETAKIEAKTSEGKTIKFTSLDTSVVTVDKDGNVQGVSLGETKIRVSVEGFPDVKVEVSVTIKARELTISGESEVFAGSTITLTATDEKGGTDFIWDSENSSIATVSQTGVVTGVKVGKVNIMVVSSITGEVKMKEIEVLTPDVEAITVSKRGTGKVLLLDEVKLVHSVVPAAANQEVTWRSSDESIATVDEEGNVTTHKSGTVNIIATSAENEEIEGHFELVVELDPIALIRRFNVENPVHKRASSKLLPSVNELIYGSVNLYWPADMNLKQNIVPIDEKLDESNGTKSDNPYIGLTATQEIIDAVELKSIRPGVKKTSIDNIIFHDTGNNNLGSGAQMHHNWMTGGGRTLQARYRSWHYTVDDQEIIQHLPDDEIAFHGDGYEAYTTTIGIETAIDKNSDFFTTWHRTAKLMSSLMYKYDLNITNIKQHYDYSGKDCPQVLRATGLWETALDLIQAEYLVLQELEGYTIEFISNDPEFVTNEGRIIKLDIAPRLISYQVRITNDEGYNQTTVLYSTLPVKIS